MCTNTDGSFTCDCLSAFEGDGETCIGVYVVLIISRYVIVVLLLQILMNVIWILTTVTPMLSVQILMVALYVLACLVLREMERLVQVFMCLFPITCDYYESALFCFVKDIDECNLDTDNCHTNAQCSNTDGSFTCNCLSGFEGDGETCTGI